MKTSIQTGLLALTLLAGVIHAHAQGTAFTYQGRLDSAGAPYNGNAEIQATLWDAASGGGQLAVNAPEQVIVAVTNGLFLLPLNFGANFPGADRWLQLEVRTSIGAFNTLAPRQPITPTPYALTAGNLTGTLPAVQLRGVIPSANLAGAYSGAVTFDNADNSFSGSGVELTGLNANHLAIGTVPDARLGANVARTNQVWLLGGNAGTTGGTHFLGTTDNQPVEFKVNGVRALRLEPTANADAVNVIGGSPWNAVGTGVVGATIAGGGGVNVNTNTVLADYGTVGGGLANYILAHSAAATVAGGVLNQIGTNVVGGQIGGGFGNRIRDNSQYTTVAGGFENEIGTDCNYSAIGGGNGNDIANNSSFATIPGGLLNAATNYAFAAGRRAKANHQGAFVWADSQDANFASTVANQVSFRCQGGVRFASGAGGANQTVAWSPGSASWSFTSDRDAKENLQPVNPQSVLDRVSQLPLHEWSYIGYPQRHLGPMAQDFHAAFPWSGDEHTLNSADLDGVALAAIQGLNHKVEMGKQKAESMEQRLEQKETEITELKQELAEIKRLLVKLSNKEN